MKEIKLLSLALENFKGAKKFTFTPGGHNASVFGDNGTGKTTLADAFWWLLSGKDSFGRADYDIKTIRDGELQHGLEHSVTGVFSVDGQKITFRRTYKERWVKKKGAADAEFSGHETEYAVNNVPFQKSEYEAAIAQVFGLNPKTAEETIFLLSHPQYFSETLHWERRRKLLMGICGDLTLDEVCAQTPELAALPGLLGNRTPEDGRKIAVEASKRLNQELKELPARIDEIQRQIPANLRNPEVIKAELAQAHAELESAKNASTDDATRRELAAVETEIAEVEAKIRALELKAKAERDGMIAGYAKVERDARLAVSETKTALARLQRKKDDLELELNIAKEKIGWELEEYAREETTQYPNSEIADSCPACGQSLPEQRIAEAKRKNSELMAAWLDTKRYKLEEIKFRGTVLREKERNICEEIKKAEAELEHMALQHANMQNCHREAQARLQTARNAPQIDSPELLDLRGQHAELILKRRESGQQYAHAETAKKVVAISERIRMLNSELGEHEAAMRLIARRNELKARREEVADEYDRQQRIISLAEVFIRRKAELLEGAINKTFRTAHFQLFRQQINGGIEECLETMVDGVPYGGLNHAMKIQAGMEIIDVLGENLGLRFPVWVDQRESITMLPKIEAQVIDLVVSETDKELRIKVKE